MGKLLNLALKQYQDYNIDEKKLINFLNEATIEFSTLNTGISNDIAIMSELDKVMCLYLKQKIIEGNLDYEILVIEKYKYLFSRFDIKMKENEKEDLLLDSIKSYDGKESFPIYTIRYIKKRIGIDKKQNNLNINKLKVQLQNQSKSENYNVQSTDILYKYFNDIDDVLCSDISAKEKIVILLKFGYIDSKYYRDEFVSKLLKTDINEVKKIYKKNKENLKLVIEEDINKHYIKNK